MTRSTAQNAFETTLTAPFGPTDLTANVVEVGALTSPCYLVIESDDDAQREVIFFDGVFGATTFVTTSAVSPQRYLSGSAQSSGLTHSVGETVRSMPVTQQHSELHDLIEGLDHGDIAGLSDDDHPQYFLATDHDTGHHDLLSINADTVDGQHASEFAADSHDHDSDYSALSHLHDNATTVIAGFMSASDKDTLDTLTSSGGAPNQTIVAGAGLTGGGATNSVTVSHDDTSSQSSLDKVTGAGVIDKVNVDTYGHVTSLTGKTLTNATVGAAATVHTHDNRYYTESEIGSSFNSIEVTRQANFPVGNASESGITWDNTLTAGWSGLSGDKIYDDGEGLYVVTCSVVFASNATGFRQLILGHDNATVAVAKAPAVNGDSSALCVSWVGGSSSCNQYWQPKVYQTSGGTLNVTAYFNVAKIGVF